MASKSSLQGGIAAASGIGKEVAFAFAESGARMVLFADINDAGAENAARKSADYATALKYNSFSFKVDVTDEQSILDMVDYIVRKLGRIDYFVNCAGVSSIPSATTDHLKGDFFDKMMQVNVKGTELCLRAVAAAMMKQEPLEYTSRRHGTRSLGRGSIFTLGFVNSFAVAPGILIYAASQRAVIDIAKSTAMELRSEKIRVNAVCPSLVDTPMMDTWLREFPGLAASVLTMSPPGRTAKVDEVADYIVFLCSPSASYISETALRIDSGMTLTAEAPS
ncbi:hypothetical protein F5Y15DRAFT_412295 [Xylariaceae sp. FL0016]|nr:hypothetical protein F5Y15DRAFT_412295 [Xylariaceae sp. FL0016]